MRQETVISARLTFPLSLEIVFATAEIIWLNLAMRMEVIVEGVMSKILFSLEMVSAIVDRPTTTNRVPLMEETVMLVTVGLI
jgi:hypothetical protein